MRRITLTHAFLIASAFFAASIGVRTQEPDHEPSMLFLPFDKGGIAWVRARRLASEAEGTRSEA